MNNIKLSASLVVPALCSTSRRAVIPIRKRDPLRSPWQHFLVASPAFIPERSFSRTDFFWTDSLCGFLGRRDDLAFGSCRLKEQRALSTELEACRSWHWIKKAGDQCWR